VGYVAFFDFVLSVPDACFYCIVDAFEEALHLHFHAGVELFEVDADEFVGGVHDGVVDAVLAELLALVDGGDDGGG
jgi:hypothetical protein